MCQWRVTPPARLVDKPTHVAHDRDNGGAGQPVALVRRHRPADHIDGGSAEHRPAQVIGNELRRFRVRNDCVCRQPAEKRAEIG